MKTDIEEIEVESAAEAYLEIARKYGVDLVIGSPGSEFIPFWEALAKFEVHNKKPRYINARHEGLALAIARGYGMATGIPQIVLLHVSFGLLHGAMEIKALFNENIPAIIIAGQNLTHEEEVWGGTAGPHYLAFTEVGGTQRLVNYYVKWCHAPDTNLNINYILARAFRIARSVPKGPVLLVLSRELMFEAINTIAIPSRIQASPAFQADPTVLKRLASLLVHAETPLLYTRYLGRNPKTVDSLVRIAELLAIPVIETPSYMNFPTNHPLHLGYDITPFMKEADLIFVVDSSSWPPWYPPNKAIKTSQATIVFLDIDPIQIKYPYWGYPADLLITADSSLALPELVKTVKPLITESMKNTIEERYTRLLAEHNKQRKTWIEQAMQVQDQKPIDPRWLCYNINEVINDETILVNETITHGRTINKYIERNRVMPGTRFEGAGATASAGLGQGLGVALGMKLANPDKTVIALEGDGSFNYNPIPSCFGLAQEYNISFLTILFDNQSYAAMKHHPRYYSKGWSVRTATYHGVYQKPKVEYSKLAEAFQGYTEIIDDPQEIKPALNRSLSQVRKGRFALLDVILPEP